MPQYLKRRLGSERIQIYLTVLLLVLYVLTRVSSNLYAGAIFIQEIFPINIYLAVCILLAITAVFTVIGGLKAVMWTDTIQIIIMLIGALIMTVYAFDSIDGYGNLEEKYMSALPTYRMLKIIDFIT